MTQKQFSQKKILKIYNDLYENYREKYGKIALLYQVGTFYQFYGLEKKNMGNISQICNDINLTHTRATKKIIETSEDNPDLAGFNLSCKKDKIKELINHNYTVIIYNEHSLGNKKFERRLEKIITPSTYIDEISETESPMILSLYFQEDIYASLLDLSTAKIQCFILNPEKLNKIIKIYKPKEIISNKNFDNCKIINFEKEKEKISFQEEFLKKIFPSKSHLSAIERLGFEKYPFLINSLIIVLEYINSIDQTIIKNLSKPKINNDTSKLYINYRTLSQLNVFNGEKSLYDILNFVETSGGKRALKEKLLYPITNPKILNRRYTEITNFPINIKFQGIIDLERFHRKIILKNIHPFEFYKLHQSYEIISEILKKEIFLYLIDDLSINKFLEFCNFYKKEIKIECILKYNIDNISENIFYDEKLEKIDDELKKK